MLLWYIVALLAAVPLLLVAARWREEHHRVDRWFDRFDLPFRRADFRRPRGE